ncbi:hypothetical protein R70723_06840 [Paenibacillus sp. FSL R7-0273]|uniref:hypothetical protein n=1 Tax=Paenibacillus sp. FSL R7-0273 TaxID=1536772 RepID=UPI0004F5D541|nr:hypothetical protein [Paenibacillus sp. FSL R7-0273]AIQ45639.1 hypothetical protein R70723_06840 [Paenibacillus sp. FSL R7-0273]OMF95162.1 hypothetical protein BK144_06395 [Paenibacillus sp. FSL R7-0273]
MKWEELKPGQPVKINAGYHTGKTGIVVAVGTFEGGPYRIGALVDIAEPLLIIIRPESLEELPQKPLPSGWEEFEI